MRLPAKRRLSRFFQRRRFTRELAAATGMTEEQIKEQLSRHFVELIANRDGFKCVSPQPDHGCDLMVHRALPIKVNGVTQYIETGEVVQVQLKSTCDASVELTPDSIKYDLSAKTYNALVHRRNSGSAVPYLLALLVLPDDPNEWLEIGADELYLRRTAYWWYPQAGLTYTDNVSTQRISIPLTQTIGMTFVADRFAEYFA